MGQHFESEVSKTDRPEDLVTVFTEQHKMGSAIKYDKSWDLHWCLKIFERKISSVNFRVYLGYVKVTKQCDNRIFQPLF